MANEYLNKEEFTYFVQLIKQEFSKYVQAVEGKGLSTEDFTTELKQKLEDISEEDIETALDGIIAQQESIISIQNTLMGGGE